MKDKDGNSGQHASGPANGASHGATLPSTRG